MYTWGNSSGGDSNLDGTRDWDFTGTVGGAEYSEKPKFIFYVAWSNPNSTEQVAKDAMMLTIECVLTAGASADTDVPTLLCSYVAKDGSTIAYDLHPVANYDAPSSVFDTYDGIPSNGQQ